MTEPEVLTGGTANRGKVVRIADRVHRPRGRGADVAEALLIHLERVGFDGAPRFVGHDDEGRQVLTFIEGTVHPDQRPPWIDDDEANAKALGRIAALVRELHLATEGFVPPDGAETFRPLPIPGSVWNHADVHYGNAVYRGDDPVGLIDWECCAPAGRMYDPATLLLCARNPRPDRPDNERREWAASLVAEAVLDGYGASDDERAAFRDVIAAAFDDVADFWLAEGAGVFTAGNVDEWQSVIDRFRWIADWWRSRR